LGFSVILIGYMRVSSSDECQDVDLQLDANATCIRFTGVTSAPAWKPALLGGCIA